MTTGLKIKEVADASGFTPATLRYYEQIGLLPMATRTPAGYRMYDRHTLDRLAFIARAKQLGCSLEEITGLTTAWDGGLCGPVQDQLRDLVAGKIVAATNQIAELDTFLAELQLARVALERHRPDGACDSNCGCVGDANDVRVIDSTDQPVMFSRRSSGVADEAVVCSLSAESMKDRLGEWASLLDHVQRRDQIDGGIRATFARSVPADVLIRLVAAEVDCCRFFQFAITVDTRGIALEVRAPADAQSLVESMFGVAS
jgi:MerR family transcriptional regulator, copper efflux regulator